MAWHPGVPTGDDDVHWAWWRICSYNMGVIFGCEDEHMTCTMCGDAFVT